MPAWAVSGAVRSSGTGEVCLPAAAPVWPGNPARHWHLGAHVAPASIEMPAL